MSHLLSGKTITAKFMTGSHLLQSVKFMHSLYLNILSTLNLSKIYDFYVIIIPVDVL